MKNENRLERVLFLCTLMLWRMRFVSMKEPSQRGLEIVKAFRWNAFETSPQRILIIEALQKILFAN
jgi:hypothetical protein